MNNRYLILLTSLCLTMSANADPITRDQARQKAEQYLQNKQGSRRLSPISNTRKLAPAAKRVAAPSVNELYYVFNRGDQEGFVIVAGDDRVEGVLGYTENGEFDYEQLPCNMKYWLDEQAEYVAYIEQHPDYAPLRVTQHAAIEPMVTTKWNQGSPFNDECPMYFSLGRSITGCVATAMAQVLYYQRDKSVTETQAAIPAYTTRTAHETYGKLQVEGIPAGSPIDWDNMIDNYNNGAGTAVQKKAVAQLMHYCGVAVEMDYTNSSSGAFSHMVDDAFNNYFGYGTAARYVYSGNYNDDTWDALLYRELEQGRPFYISGSNDSGGHAFVGDGYQDGCFHINWGWGGGGPDGYYALNKMNPGSQGLGGSDGGYANGQEAIINCEPEDYSSKAMPIANATVKKLCLANWDTDGNGTFTYGEAAAVTDLGDVFKGQNFTTFAELYYFTGLTTIGDDAFSGCTRMTTVRLPKKLKAIGARAFQTCAALKELSLPEGLVSIGEAAFSGCRKLTDITIPAGIIRIEDETFKDCQTFKSVELPICVTYIGTGAFSGCTKITDVVMKSVTPQNIELGTGVFEGVSVGSAKLSVLQGLSAYYRSADQWRDFGEIYEMRTLSQGKFATLETGKQYYLYHIGTGYYLTHGEAYGTQGVVADTDSPMRFEFRHTATMDDDVYYLYSKDSPNTNYVFFRSATDGNVGAGVKACFVDGPSSKVSATGHPAYWTIQLADGQSNVYTIQPAAASSDYVDGEYLGVQPDHASNASYPTYGTYYDIKYEDAPQNCQWMLVEYDGDAELINTYTTQLSNLLSIANTKHVDTTQEQAVYDDFNSSLDDIQKACRRLRRKLDFINFQEESFREAILAKYDTDGNKEISYSEAASVPKFASSFLIRNTELTTLDDLKYFTKLSSVSDNCFNGCNKVLDVTLANSVVDIYTRAFQGCSKLERVTLSSRLENIADNAFYNCIALQELYVPVEDPATITLGSNVFYGVKQNECVLYVPQGARERYAQAEVWKDFTDIREMRTAGMPDFIEAQPNVDVYVYNLGMRRYINKGEAYGTQAVVATTGMVYQLRKATSVADTYYLYSDETGKDNKVLFRTDSDGKVGEGVRACFVDGTVSNKAYWKFVPVEGKTGVYTLQTPANDASYVDGEYLGTELSHTTGFTSSTRGLYWDVNYDSNPEGCQWGLVSVADVEASQEFYDLTQQLAQLLAVAAPLDDVDASQEQAVYDNFSSSRDDINAAILSLREKLGYLSFVDARAKTITVNTWDDNEDGEISEEEAAAITDIATIFRSAGALKSLEDLRYFTALTAVPDEAFRSNAALIAATLPEGVTSIGANAFASCSNLKYLALLNPSQVVATSNGSGLPSRNLTVFVPADMLEAYQADEQWNKYTILEYTGTPTVTAEPASRQYGRTTLRTTYAVSGAPINGEPLLEPNLDALAPVGTYPIEVSAGTITSRNLVCVNGELTVEPAPLTVTAKSYSRNINEPNPDFELTYSTLRNREKIEDVLTQQPTISCDATIDSPGGVYEIRVSGAQAQNYEFTYVNGTLTIVDPVGINDAKTDAANRRLYDIAGRKVSTTKRGIYIDADAKQKVVNTK